MYSFMLNPVLVFPTVYHPNNNNLKKYLTLGMLPRSKSSQD